MNTTRKVYSLGNYYILKTIKGHEVYQSIDGEDKRVARIVSIDGLQRAIEWIRKQKAVNDFEASNARR